MDAVKTCMRPSLWRRSLVLLAALVVVLLSSHGALAADGETPPSTPSPDSSSTPAPKPKTAPLQDASSKRATLEMATYADTDHVTVLSPSISASIENVTQGASLRGTYLVDVVS